MVEWNQKKFNEDEKHRFLTRLTSTEMAPKININKCTTSKQHESIWPPLLRETFPEFSIKKNQEYTKWLAGGSQKKKPLRYILDALVEGYARELALQPNVNNK